MLAGGIITPRLRRPAGRRGRAARGRGQVVVEILLALPVFLFMIFLIMEVGYIAFQTILTQHAAYECARIGSMLAGEIQRPHNAPAFEDGRAKGRASEALNKMIRGARITGFEKVKTLDDPQTRKPNYDLVVEVTNRTKLIFPFSSALLSTPRGTCCRNIVAIARMPVENPNPYTLP